LWDSARVALRDYRAWHDDYDRPGSPLHLRLLVVEDLIARALDELPPGPVHVVSMCAGQGRDIATVARRHRRGTDLTGRLVELDPANATSARQRLAAAGLDELEVVEADAGQSDAYDGAVPAELVVACGVFGNITSADVENTIRFLPALCDRGAWVVWTRLPDDDTVIPTIERWFTAAGFEARARVVPDDRSFAVGAAQLTTAPPPFTPGQRLFEFVR
jgi:hypothetical protein